jgi:hypothetical protein
MADDDYYPPLVHRSRYRPDETPFDPLQGVSPAPSPFEMFNPDPVNPFGGDSEDFTTAHVNAAYDREQDYNQSIFGKVKNWLYSKPDEAPEEINNGVREQPYDLTTPGVRDAEMQGGGATVFGKGLGALGLDESGDRANTTWGQSVGNTLEALNPFALAQGGANTMNNWASSVKYPEKLETPDMLAPFGLAAMVAPFAPVNAVGMLGGRLSKNPAHAAGIKRAEEMAAQGASRDDIWKETMAFQAPDGHWKVEIDDSRDFQLKAPLPDEGDTAWLEKVFSSPNTQAAYPDLYGGTEIMRGAGGNRGMWQHGDVRPEGVVIPHNLQVGKGATRSTVGHEVQHGIQREEGCATGGSLYGAFPAGGKGGAWPIYRERLEKITTPKSLEDFAREAGYDSPADAAVDHAKYVKAIEQMRKNGVPANLDKAAQEGAAQDWYKRLAGEAEARAVQERMSMTADERKARPFWLDYDVPEDQQIVRFGGDRFASTESPFSPRGAEAPSGANSPDSLPEGPFTVRNKGENIGSEALSGMSRPGFVYRGMTADEYDATLGAGRGVQSRGDYSHSSEGTNFAEDLASAESYVNYGRDDPRKTGRPTYIVEAPADGMNKGGDGYFKTQGETKPSRVWRVEDRDGALVATRVDGQEGGPFTSGANSPDSLPMDEASRLARAREMNTDLDHTWYHGSKDDVPAFDLRKAGKSDPGLVGRAAYLTPSPGQASDFAMNPLYGKGDSPNVMPLHTRMKNPAFVIDGVLPDGRTLTDAHPNGITKESAKALHDQFIKQGHDGVIFKTGDGEYTQAAVFDPSLIRSKYAAFDPAKKDSPFLLAADQAKASLPGVFAQAAEREGKGPFRRKDDD